MVAQTFCSVGFLIKFIYSHIDYDMASGKYSTWTESVWPELTARMFLKPSFYQEVITLVLGISVLGLSFASVFYINGRKEILFNPG